MKRMKLPQLPKLPSQQHLFPKMPKLPRPAQWTMGPYGQGQGWAGIYAPMVRPMNQRRTPKKARM